MTRDLRPGDVLLYKGKGLFSLLIRIKSWHPQTHVEVYIGNGRSAASRDGKGVAIYPVRLDDLAHVLRPDVPFDRAAAMRWFAAEANGLPYGWADLLVFVGLNINHRGVVCSAFATQFLRAGGVAIFNNELAERVAPFQFLLSESLTERWNDQQGWIDVAMGV